MPVRSRTTGETRAQKRSNQLASDTPLWRRLRTLGSELGGDWRPIHTAGHQVEPPLEPTAFGEVEIVEGDGRLDVRHVGTIGEASRFEFFLDGIEHTHICGYVGIVPIVHGYVAAVIRQRSDRTFVTWDVIEKEVLAFPHELLRPDRLLELGFPREALIDSEADAAGPHPIKLAEDERAAVKLQRALIERRLARRWADERPGEGWLLVDGPLAIEPALLKSGRAVGLVKSHRTQYLAPAEMREVLEMGGGYRSSVFKPVRPEVGEVYSWYLRLRPPGGHDIYWALARIEGRAEAETLELADEVSRWLLAETTPLALPDPRWHVLLYPIRDCETYLRSRMPTLEIS
jgi:hypothetical protein